jgi:phage tail-like protein
MTTSPTANGPSLFYPTVAFAFRLQMVGAASQVDETGFQEVSGLSVEMETEAYREGGQNLYSHKLPTGVKGGTLVLKRGYVSTEQPLYQWCAQILQGGLSTPIKPATFNLQLLTAQGDEASSTGASGDILKSWTFLSAWPTKWEVSGFNAKERLVLMESLEISYSTVSVTTP